MDACMFCTDPFYNQDNDRKGWGTYDVRRTFSEGRTFELVQIDHKNDCTHRKCFRSYSEAGSVPSHSYFTTQSSQLTQSPDPNPREPGRPLGTKLQLIKSKKLGPDIKVWARWRQE